MTTMDVVTRVGPLGLRFWDAVRSDVVREGLRVRAWPEHRPMQLQTARVNRSGVWSFVSLPGLTAFESGSGDASYWNAVENGTDPRLRPRHSFVIEVVDTAGRFLPLRLRLALPVRGLSAWPPLGLATGEVDLEAPADAVPLFSAPQRATAEMAVVRAELVDAVSGAPARDALVEALRDGVLVGRGLSDEKGRAVVVFSYPEPDYPIVGGPVGSPPQGHANSWAWDLVLRVRWRATPEATFEPPLLTSLLANPLVTALGTRSPETPLGLQTLRYGDELLVHTSDSAERRLCIRS